MEIFMFHSSLYQLNYTFSKYVTEFAKRDLIHATNFATLLSHNFVCD